MNLPFVNALPNMISLCVMPEKAHVCKGMPAKACMQVSRSVEDL